MQIGFEVVLGFFISAFALLFAVISPFYFSRFGSGASTLAVSIFALMTVVGVAIAIDSVIHAKVSDKQRRDEENE